MSRIENIVSKMLWIENCENREKKGIEKKKFENELDRQNGTQNVLDLHCWRLVQFRCVSAARTPIEIPFFALDADCSEIEFYISKEQDSLKKSIY